MSEQSSDVGRWRLIINVIGLERTDRHISRLRIRRVLHDGYAAAPFYGGEPCGSVIQVPRDHHPNNSRAKGDGRRPKQRIDRRPRHVLTRAASQPEDVFPYQKVMIWGRHVNPVAFNWLSISAMDTSSAAFCAEDAREGIWPIRPYVDDNEDGRGEIGR